MSRMLAAARLLVVVGILCGDWSGTTTTLTTTKNNRVSVSLVEAAGGWGCSNSGRNHHHHHRRRGHYHPYHGGRRFTRRSDAFDLISDILTIPVNSLLRQSVQHHQRSPKYEIFQEGDMYELSLEVPGVKAEDLTVELLIEEDDDVGEHYVLKVSGKRLYRSFGGIVQESQFEKSFQLDDDDVDVNKLSVSLSNGILTISAPKFRKKKKKVSRRRQLHIHHDDDDDEDAEATITRGGEKDNDSSSRDTVQARKVSSKGGNNNNNKKRNKENFSKESEDDEYMV